MAFSKTTDSTHQDILDLIDSATHPDNMGYTEAVSFLEELSADIDGRIDALNEENED